MILAPFTEEDVKALNAYQNGNWFHPYTCPGDKPDCKDRRNLIATSDGWVCQCGEYRQEWAHAYTLNGANPPGDWPFVVPKP